MSTPYLFIGARAERLCALKIDNAAFDISGATVTAQLRNPKTSAAIGSTVSVSASDAAADFSQSLVNVVFLPTDTDDLTSANAGYADLEIRVLIDAANDETFLLKRAFKIEPRVIP